jgi:hypothetical protein
LTTDGLRLASIEITRRCNGSCAYCEQPKAEDDIPLSRFTEILGRLSADGVEAVALGGGEPTLHPELPALLEAARRIGLRAGLTTNARDPTFVDSLAERGLLDGFGVSAGKGEWTALAGHPLATLNLLLLRGGVPEVLHLAAVRRHSCSSATKAAAPSSQPPSGRSATHSPCCASSGGPAASQWRRTIIPAGAWDSAGAAAMDSSGSA